MNSLCDVYSKFENDNHVFVYAGQFSDALTNLLINLKEEQQAGLDLKKSYVRRTSYLLVECFQNVVRHGNEVVSVQDKFNFFKLRTKNDRQLLATSNPVIEKDKEILTDLLLNLHNKTKEEIALLYTSTLSEGTRTERGGGGLGLIDIAKKTGRSPMWDISIGKSGVNEFCIQIEMEAVLSDKLQYDIVETKELRDFCFENGITLLRKGGFSQAEILPIFEMIKENNQNSNLSYITIELMQNLQKHSMNPDNPEGIFLIKRKEEGTVLEAGNIIDQATKDTLKEKLDYLSNLDEKQLKAMYRAQLMKDSTDEKGGAGIGLIEIFRHSKGKVAYNFEDLANGKVFYSIKVLINEL